MKTTESHAEDAHRYWKKQDNTIFLFSCLHSGCLVPSTGVEDLLLALWESLVAFPVLWKKNGPCLNSRKCLSSFCIDKKHQPHGLFTVRTNQLLTDLLCSVDWLGQGSSGGGHWKPIVYLFSVYFYVFCFLGKGWFHCSPWETNQNLLDFTHCVSMFTGRKIYNPFESLVSAPW